MIMQAEAKICGVMDLDKTVYDEALKLISAPRWGVF